jgi:serine/threonine-protein kinase
MASVYLGRLNGEVGFGRTVAIKRLHPHLAGEAQFVSMFLDEARLASRIQHPNVVPTLDVVTLGEELFIVMEYVKGEPLVSLLKTATSSGTMLPIPVVTAIMIGVLNGLHAAHVATDERGQRLMIVHRDVSPQNILVGVDGVARVLDFGIAKAAMRLQSTREGQLKGKLAYMAPEQLSGEVTHHSDIYSAGIVLWEMLTCRRLFTADTEAQLLRKVMDVEVKEPSRHNPDVPPELDRIVMTALARDPRARYATARAMSEDLDAAMRPASTNAVADWVESLGHDSLSARNRLVAELEHPGGDISTETAVHEVSQVGEGERDETKTVTVSGLTHVPFEHETPSRVGSLTRDIQSMDLAGRPWLIAAVAAGAAIPVIGAVLFLVRPTRPPETSFAESAVILDSGSGEAVPAVQPEPPPFPPVVATAPPPPTVLYSALPVVPPPPPSQTPVIVKKPPPWRPPPRVSPAPATSVNPFGGSRK